MREFITVQLGHYSNFVGTQWWNIQEAGFSYDPKHPSELNNDLLFREGCTLKGESTYTPRLISVDLKGSLGTLRRHGTLYEGFQGTKPSWSSKVHLHQEKPLHKNEFLRDLDKQDEIYSQRSPLPVDEDKDIEDVSMEDNPSTSEVPLETEDFDSKVYDLKDEDVRVWSDILRVHFHPRSVLLVDEYMHEAETQQFNLFPQGREVWKNQMEDELGDSIRFYAEECDNLGAFHCLTNTQDGFGGLTERVLEHLEDEYSGKVAAVFPCLFNLPETSSTNERKMDLINVALGMSRLSSVNESAIVSPLSVFSNWTHLTPSVFPNVRYEASSWYHSSSILALSLETLTSAFRLKSGSGHLHSVVATLTQGGRRCAAEYSSFSNPQSCSLSITSLTPAIPEPEKTHSVLSVGRGRPTREESSKLLEEPAINISEPCQRRAPFPLIFEDDSVTMSVSSWRTGKGIGESLMKLFERVERYKPAQFHVYMEAGMEKDEVSDCLHQLQDMAENYANC